MAWAPTSPSYDGLRLRAEELAAGLPSLLVQAERIAATVSQGVHGRRRVGAGETFWQFRRYQPGDPVSAIDWRQSAKSARVYIRQNEWEAAQSIWLWRDASASMDYRSDFAPTTKKQRASLLLLALTCLLSRAGEQIALLGRAAKPRTGPATIDRIAATLLRDPEADDNSLPAVIKLPRHAQVVLIGDFLSPLAEIDERVRAYAADNVSGHLLQVVDPAEEDLPFAGRARFEGVEGEGAHTVGRVETLRADYGRRIAGRVDGLKAIARTAGWSFASHRTDRPPQSALLALFMALSEGNR